MCPSNIRVYYRKLDARLARRKSAHDSRRVKRRLTRAARSHVSSGGDATESTPNAKPALSYTNSLTTAVVREDNNIPHPYYSPLRTVARRKFHPPSISPSVVKAYRTCFRIGFLVYVSFYISLLGLFPNSPFLI